MAIDDEMSKEALIAELQQARSRIEELEELERSHQALESAFRESETQTRAVLDQTFQFIGVMKIDGTLTHANRTALDFSGIDETDVVGKPFWDGPWWNHSRNLQKTVEKAIQRAAEGELVRFEATHPSKTGEMHYMDVSIKPVKDEMGRVICIIPEGRDITELKLQGEQMKQLALAIEFSAELVNIATLDGRMTFLNPAGQAMLGIDSEQVTSTNIMQVIPDSLTNLVETELLPSLEGGGTWRGELQYLNLKTGKLHDVHATTFTVPHPETGEPMFLANVSMSLADLKKAERERRELRTQVQHMQKLESLGVLAGGIAHDFNNLLTGISGNAELAAMETGNESPILRYLEMILLSSKQATELCKQMLAFSGRGRFLTSTLDLPQVIDKMTPMLKMAISKQVSLSYDMTAVTRPIDADAAQIQQIILNLVTNASEAIGDVVGGITVRVGSRHCDRSYLQTAYLNESIEEGEFTFIQVEDTGCGMSQDTISKIFDPFFTSKFTGRGLGLSAVLGILRGHKGSVIVDSAPGEGSRFTLLFPAAVGTTLEHSVSPNPPTDWHGHGTVLVVDDEEIVRVTVSAMLQSTGYHVLTAKDGQEGLAVFKEHQSDIVLVLLDLTMPKMSGEQTFGELKAIQPDIPILICSGYNELELARRFGENTAIADFLQKPFQLKDLLTKLKALLG